MSKEDGNMTPSQAFEQLSLLAEYVNGLKNMLTENGWSEENAQAIILVILSQE